MADKKHVSGSTSEPKTDIMKMADDTRSKANSMSDAKREESFNYGMQLIYGGSSGITAKVRSA